MSVWVVRAFIDAGHNLLYFSLVVGAVIVAVKTYVVHEAPEPGAGLTISFEGEPPRKAYQHLEHGTVEVHPFRIYVESLGFEELMSQIPPIFYSVVIIRNEPDELFGVELSEKTPVCAGRRLETD